MRISDWSSDVCSSDLLWRSAKQRMESVTCCSYALFCQCPRRPIKFAHTDHRGAGEDELFDRMAPGMAKCAKTLAKCEIVVSGPGRAAFLEHHLGKLGEVRSSVDRPRSEEHTSELQSLMRISYAVFCLKKN